MGTEGENKRITDATGKPETKADAVEQGTFTGQDKKQNQEAFFNQIAQNNQDGMSETSLKAKLPGESDADYIKRVQDTKSNKLEIVDNKEPDFMPGYTRKEADKYFKEVCAKDNWSNSDMEFMKDYEKAKQGHGVHKGSVSADASTGSKSDAEAQKPTDAPKKVPQTKFELGGEADLVGWERWQHRMNQAVFEKLNTLMQGSHVPAGSHCAVEYTVNKNGSFDYKFTEGNNQEYINIVERAINETLRFHPELRKFPPEAKENSWHRNVTFNAGVKSGYSTGDVHDEIIKK